jgi:hypothetical protein
MKTDDPQIHTCSYYCHRPECTKAQRDQMRDWILAALGTESFRIMMSYPHKAIQEKGKPCDPTTT